MTLSNFKGGSWKVYVASIIYDLIKYAKTTALYSHLVLKYIEIMFNYIVVFSLKAPSH